MIGGVAYTAQSSGHDRVGSQCPSRGVHRHVVAQIEHVGQQQFFVGERRLQLGNLDRAHTNTLTARAAVDAAETMLRVALSGAGTVVDTGADGADEADEAVDAQPDEAFCASTTG